MSRQNLDCDRAIQPRVTRAIHFSHAARTQRRLDFIRSEFRARDKCHPRGRIIVPMERRHSLGGTTGYPQKWLHSPVRFEPARDNFRFARENEAAGAADAAAWVRSAVVVLSLR